MLEKVLLGPDVDPEPWVAKWRAMDRNDMTYPLDALIGRDDITSSLMSLVCPSIVIHGTDDIAIEISMGRQLADSLRPVRNLRDQERWPCRQSGVPTRSRMLLLLFLADID